MNFDVREVARRVTALGRDRLQRGGQAGCTHCSLQRDAVGVALFQPARIKLADQCARTQEGCLVSLALFLSECDELDPVAQPTTGQMQLLDSSERDQHPQASVVLSAVANRVVVTTGQQPRSLAIGAVVDRAGRGNLNTA